MAKKQRPADRPAARKGHKKAAPPPTPPPRFPDASRARAKPLSQAPRGPGRPTIRTPELVARLLEWTADSGTLRAFCRLPGSPSYETVYSWLDKDPELKKAFDKARLLGGLQLAEEILEIANTPRTGEIVTEETTPLKDAAGVEVMDKWTGKPLLTTKRTVRTEDMLGHRKLQIEARERLLKLWFPEWFAKKVDVDHKSGGKSFDVLLRQVLGDDKPESAS